MAAKKYLIAVEAATLAAANAPTGSIVVSAAGDGGAAGTGILVAEILDVATYKNILGQSVVTVSTAEGMLPAFTVRNIASPAAAMPAPVHSATQVATTDTVPAIDPLGIVAGDQYRGSSFEA